MVPQPLFYSSTFLLIFLLPSFCARYAVFGSHGISQAVTFCHTEAKKYMLINAFLL